MVEITKSDRSVQLSTLTAISPLDGRYRNKVENLAPFASEMGLIKTRMEIEARYLIALSEVGLVRPLQHQERVVLINLGSELSLSQVERVKEIEDVTRHDVKAMERAFREFLTGTSLQDTTEMIHFGLTSEDVNNLSYRLMLWGAVHQVCIPAMDLIVDNLAQKANAYKDIPMLARTHGQPAVPTTIGKELANMAVRLNLQIRKLEGIELTGKLNGAVGNFNAHSFAAPEVDWIEFSNRFVKTLGLKPNLITTQINPYEDIIEVFQAVQRVNNVILDINQDFWRYISDEWFVQAAKKGEVGSSTMPQKVNPIDFENGEGNVQLSNSLLEGMCRKLAVSRLQRDLSDSTTIRNFGSALAYGLVAYSSTLAGLGKISPNLEMISKKLNKNWNILTEGVQTLLRRSGIEDPYSMVAGISKEKIGAHEWKEWVNGLQISGELKAKLTELTPETYVGNAAKLTDIALEGIAAIRRKS
jgi:adenylosuccinate lyase